MNELFPTGIDIGSTTVKLVICPARGEVRFSRYRRHHTRTVDTLRELLTEARQVMGNIPLDVALTGSAGMGVAESFSLPFLQEVVAAAKLIQPRWPEVRTLIEIGGEDSKIAFFDDLFQPDIRMNGNCAGGTGAFIEQMAVLLDTPLVDLDRLAAGSGEIHPIASRCGVFAKTDIQALLANRVSREDIAASVFQAMALQVVSSLARGCEIRPKVLFAGGPLTFFPRLRQAFIGLLDLDPQRDLVRCEHPELIAAEGAARYHGEAGGPIFLDNLLARLTTSPLHRPAPAGVRLSPLFRDPGEYDAWEERHRVQVVPRIGLDALGERSCYLGIDSGSTTTKLALIDGEGRVALTWYAPNGGDPVGTVRRGLNEFLRRCREAGAAPRIVRTATTGYGEDLIRAAFALDDGVVETMAHYRAARSFVPAVSFILDIGGQDMKAIHVRDGFVTDIQVNEACSSGCGSFIETFARSLECGVAEFARGACAAKAPFDLGTRCTVFMNSRVKQALREDASVDDIAAGLAYSVIKNSLYKVLKLKDPTVLGENIVVQGGTFRNQAVLRAFELLVGREVTCPDISEIMGAYGAALTARQNHLAQPDTHSSFGGLEGAAEEAFTRRELHCAGCENRCRVVRTAFAGGRSYFSGNRCERHYSNGAHITRPGENLFAVRCNLLFDRPRLPESRPLLTFGIPRVLNLYENYPFWQALLTTCGFRVLLSGPSGAALYEKGVATVMSDNICLPAKLVHGHIVDLIEKRVDRIFFPIVIFEQPQDREELNSFNCPVVTGYPDVVKSAIDPEGRCGIPIDSPVISFRDVGLLKKQINLFLKPFGVSGKRIALGVARGLEAKCEVQRQLQDRARELIRKAEERNGFCVVVAGRPYHLDPLINHGLPDLLAGYGVDVLPESAVPLEDGQNLKQTQVLTQWAYTNRILSAAKVTARNPALELLQITSFGCGLDAISIDEARETLRSAGKSYTLIKMDEITNLGAVRIRLRSMLDAIRERSAVPPLPVAEAPPESLSGRGAGRTLLVPWFSPLYSPMIPAVFASLDCRVELLSPQDQVSVELGLKYVNNDMCYPAVIVIGDILKALQSGRYDPGKTMVLLTQTFGQCRASNYLPLAKKALTAAGFGAVPVLSLSAEQGDLERDLGIDRRALIRRLALGLIFSDALARMTLATVPREIRAGSAMALQRHYLAEVSRLAGEARFQPLLESLRAAVADFNALPVDDAPTPVVGVLGEIFVKYNAFSNNNIVDWLIAQGVEVVLPSLLSFFEQRFVNEAFDQRSYLKRSLSDRVMTQLLERYVRFYLDRVERVMAGFRYHRKAHDLKSLAAETSRTASLANQAGEGWLLPAEMIGMFKDGIGTIVCLQPFGCLANHIIGKGLEKRLKSLYARLNLLFLDMDPGTSEVNILNRLHFLVLSARERLKAAPAPSGRASFP